MQMIWSQSEAHCLVSSRNWFKKYFKNTVFLVLVTIILLMELARTPAQGERCSRGETLLNEDDGV